MDFPTAPEQKVPVNPIMTENLKVQAQAPFSPPFREELKREAIYSSYPHHKLLQASVLVTNPWREEIGRQGSKSR